jgi:hypothetical protein
MMLARGLRLDVRREISVKLRGGLKMDYNFDNIWECLDAIRNRNENIRCCDIPPFMSWVLDPSGDMYCISLNNLSKSIDIEDKTKEILLRSALSSAVGKQNLCTALSAK